MIELPMEPTAPKRKNPRKTIIFGKPKCGKTEICAELTRSRNWLLLELEEGGADFTTARTLSARNLDELFKIGEAIKAKGKPYDGLIVDTCTELEDMILPLAAKLYKQTPMGGTWTGKDVRTLPKGAGYLYMREAFFQVVDYLSGLAHNIIFLGHLSDKMIEKNGEELSAKELDLTGKIKSLMGADADAIAYCYRRDNQTILNFNASDEVICGARSEHLKGKEVVVAESDEEGNLTFFWDRIFVKE